MSKITLLIKPTHLCNFSCVYCYNSSNNNNVKKSMLDKENLYKVFEVLLNQFDIIECVWLGGEPLLFGKRNFEEVFKQQIKLSNEYKVKFLNSVQTNAMLLDEEYEILFNNYNVNIGVSYDGINSLLTRGHGQDLWEKILYLRDRHYIKSVLYVLSSYNKDVLLEDYERLKSENLSMKINRFIPVDKSKSELNITNEEYAEVMFNLFERYYNDINNGALITVKPFQEFISMVKENIATSCHYGSCLSKYLCIDPMGDLYLCARHTKKLCNISDVTTYDEIILNGNYQNIIEEVLTKREKCKNCDLFYYCGGGCHFRSLINEDYCLEFKLLFPRIKKFLIDNSSYKEDL